MQGRPADLKVREVGHLADSVQRPVDVHRRLGGGEVGRLHGDFSVAVAVAADPHAHEAEAGEVLLAHDELALQHDVGPQLQQVVLPDALESEPHSVQVEDVAEVRYLW